MPTSAPSPQARCPDPTLLLLLLLFLHTECCMARGHSFIQGLVSHEGVETGHLQQQGQLLKRTRTRHQCGCPLLPAAAAGLPDVTIGWWAPLYNVGRQMLLAVLICFIDICESISIAKALAQVGAAGCMPALPCLHAPRLSGQSAGVAPALPELQCAGSPAFVQLRL